MKSKQLEIKLQELKDEEERLKQEAEKERRALI
jgi:hypothetical protein